MMKKRIVTKIGDIFSAKVDDHTKHGGLKGCTVILGRCGGQATAVEVGR